MYMSSDLEAKVSEVEMRHALEDGGNIAERLQVSKSTCRRKGRGILQLQNSANPPRRGFAIASVDDSLPLLTCRGRLRNSPGSAIS